MLNEGPNFPGPTIKDAIETLREVDGFENVRVHQNDGLAADAERKDAQLALNDRSNAFLEAAMNPPVKPQRRKHMWTDADRKTLARCVKEYGQDEFAHPASVLIGVTPGAAETMAWKLGITVGRGVTALPVEHLELLDPRLKATVEQHVAARIAKSNLSGVFLTVAGFVGGIVSAAIFMGLSQW